MDLKPVSDAASSSRLIFTPNPVTLDGQRNIAAELRPGETLAAFLARNVPEDMGLGWEVRINGVVVPHEVMPRVRPKAGTVIEVRSLVKKQALYIVAMAVLTYFTMGAGTTIGAALAGAGTGMATAINIAVFIAGSAIINKVLGPKPPEPQRESRDSVYSIGKARNQPRPYQPLPLLFGRVRIAPDVLSLPYMWHEGNDQYMGMVLTPGLNVERVDALDNGDTPLASFEAVQVYHAGFPAMPEQAIPLYSNADTVQGGELFKPDGQGRRWVERATPADTVRIQINLEYLLGDKTSKGKPHPNRATVEVQYRKTGTSAWQPLVSRTFVNSDFNPKRATLSADVPRGQYDVRVSRSGAAQEAEGQNGRAQFQWTNMTAVQADDTDYSAIPRIGVRMKATGQLNGAPDELRCVAYSKPCPVWKNGQWVTEHTSNPGAHMLAYIRGIRDAGGRLLAGMGLPDAMIDVAAFQAFMTHCAENNYTYDYWVRDARSHDEMLSVLALVGMGQYTWASGKLSVAWAAQNQPVSGVVNMATIKRASFQVDYTLANAADGIEYTYFDAEKWDTGVVRIAAPGQQDALNPARISGEGITRAEHAAELARWHLAQSLYQYKDIIYSTDLEHLSYRRLSLLQLQHDLTQWGYGGRVVAVERNGGAVTLTLDEAVPAPSAGNAYIGIRPLGERNCRVMRVTAFSGESRTIRLAEAWPADVPMPATPEDAQNLLWIYDFKQTPGYRVRVVGIQPEPGLKGASVSVVPESPEYWQYVKTGQYQRPTNQSLLQPRPVVESLRVTEAQIEQGDTVFTELQADWTASGQAAYFTVHAAKQTQGQWADMAQVAETRSTTARFRIHEAGTYKITVRPYNADGIVGGVRTVTYATSGADTAPPMFDYASVEVRGGGVRAYSFGYSTTVQPGNYAGAEIRYASGTHNAPDWAAMTPLGGDGFFTANTEATVPESGQWTVAFRPRNTSGLLGDARIVKVSLGDSLGETIGDVDGRVDAHTQQLVHAQQERDRIARESLERDAQGALNAAADAKNKADAAREAAYLRAQTLMQQAISTAALDATTKANGARDVALARINTIESQVADILSADAHSTGKTYPQGDLVQHAGKLYRAKKAVPTGIAITNTAYWEYVGEYTSLGEAVSANIALTTQTRTELQLERTRLNGIASRMPAGTGGLATQTMVLDEMTERLSADEALAGRATLVEARLGGRIDNLVAHPNFEGGTAGSWSVGSVVDVADHPNRKKALQAAGSSYLPMSDAFDCSPGETFDLRIDIQLLHASATARPQIQWWSKDGQVIGYASPPSSAHTGSTNWATGHAVSGAVAPAGAARGRPGVSITGAGARLTEFVITRRGDGMGVLDARITDVDNASASRDSAIAGRVSNVEARMPAGAGKLATAASVTDAANAAAAANQATADRVTLVEARMPTGSGKLATQASVNQAAAASASATGAVADRVANVEARMPGGNGKLATEALVASVESAASSENQAIAARASQIEARLGGRVDNLVPQANFEDGRGIWTVGTVVDAVGHPHLTKALAATSSPYLPAKYNFDVAPGEIFDLQIDAKPVSALAQIAPNIQWLDKTGAVVGYASSTSRGVRNTAEWVIGHTTTGHVAPAGAVRGRIGVSMTNGGGMFTNLVMTRRTPGMSALDARITEVAEASSNENGAIATRTSALEARANALERNADFSAAKAWEFDAGDEGWRERSGNTWIAPVHSNGAVRPERAVGRPLMLLSPALSGAAGIDGAKNNLLRFRFRTSHGRAASGLAIYFQTDAQGMSETTRVNYEIAPGAGWQVVTVDMSGNLHWIASPIRRIRIDSFGCTNVGEYVEIDYVAVGTTGVGVSSGALAQVAASVTTAEEASVSRDNALSGRITTADAKAGAAQAAATAAQQAVANETQARSQAIIGVQSRIDAQKGQSIGPNLLKNSRFDVGVDHWTKHVKDMSASAAEIGRNRGGDAWRLPDTNNLSLVVPTAKPTTAYVDARSAAFAVEPGKTYALAARIAAHRCVAKCYLVFLRANGTWRHAELVGESAGKTGGKDPNNWAHVSKAVVAPSDATQALFLFRLQVTNAVAADLHAWLTQPIICEVPAGTTVAPMYSAGSAEHAAVALELKTEVDAVKGFSSAIWGLSSNVNGLIDGMRSVNNGFRSTISFLTSTFRVVSNVLNGAGMEWEDGYLRIFATTVQMILGFNFGADNDLVFYYGPNVGAAEARKSNATIWFDKLGGAYFGGTLRAGLLYTAENRNYTTLAVGASSRLDVTHRGSNGRNKTVVIAATWGSEQTSVFASRNEAMAFVASRPPRTGSVTWRVTRGGQEIWREADTATSYCREPEFIDTVPPTWQVSHGHRLGRSASIADNSNGTGDIGYRLEVVGSSGQFYASHGVLSLGVTEE